MYCVCVCVCVCVSKLFELAKQIVLKDAKNLIIPCSNSLP